MDSSKNAPVFYGASNNGTEGALLAGLAMKDYSYDYPGMINAGGVSDLRHEVGAIGTIIKDSASNIRADLGDVKADLLREGQDNIRATLENRSAVLNKLGEVECKIIKENSDQTLYLTNQLSVIREQGIRNEFETKLSREAVIKEVNTAAQHNAERTQDKLQHGFEEINEKLCECCGEQAVNNATVTGLLNIIVSSLNIK